VYAPLNLFVAGSHVIGNQGAAGVDHQTVEGFLANRQQELDKLHAALRANTYRPQAVRRVWIPKPGSMERRPLGVPTVRDRVVQTALLHALEPITPACAVQRDRQVRCTDEHIPSHRRLSAYAATGRIIN
jgi:RNA-directed DNA polymerase